MTSCCRPSPAAAHSMSAFASPGRLALYIFYPLALLIFFINKPKQVNHWGSEQCFLFFVFMVVLVDLFFSNNIGLLSLSTPLLQTFLFSDAFLASSRGPSGSSDDRWPGCSRGTVVKKKARFYPTKTRLGVCTHLIRLRLFGSRYVRLDEETITIIHHLDLDLASCFDPIAHHWICNIIDDTWHLCV